jgi:hypothetical protein
MTRALSVAILAVTLVACLPTRNRFAFDDEQAGDTGPSDVGSGDAERDPEDTASASDGDTNEDTGPTDGGDTMADDVGMDMTTDAAMDGGSMDTGPDLCFRESDQEFCLRVGAECGTYEGTDNCGDPRSAGCGECMGDGVRCSDEFRCVEGRCWDGEDNDGVNGADCDDPNCEGRRCGFFQRCQSGSCE